MADPPELHDHVHNYRERRDWSQEELARRSGLSRSGISAIESGRLVPSTSAALALAAAFECRVEDLFHTGRAGPEGIAWAWPARRDPCRYWQATVGGRTRLYPVETTPLGVLPHDGLCRGGSPGDRSRTDPADTLIVACCDPAVGLLGAELARRTGLRLIVLARSSQSALSLLKQGLVHAAGVHLCRADEREGNAEAVRGRLGPGFQLLRVASWEEGVAFAPGRGPTTVRSAIRSDLRWVGREAGSGARQCLDELLGGRRPPRRQAADHRGVAEAVRCGWAEAGVCLRLAGEEAGLDFLSVRVEAYDLCFPEPFAHDPRLRALVEVVRSSSYRRLVGELPGYDSSETGELQPVGESPKSPGGRATDRLA